MNKTVLKEKIMEIVFLLCACVSILAVALICIFLFANGIPAMAKIGLFDFLLGKMWKPSNDIYGIFPMILGSIYVTAGAVIIGVPIGLLTAIYMAKFCPAWLYKIMKPGVDLLAGIPALTESKLRTSFFFSCFGSTAVSSPKFGFKASSIDIS